MTIDGSSNARHYTMAGDFSIMISVTDEETDLRVVFYNNVKFANHVSHCICKAHRILGVKKHTFAT